MRKINIKKSLHYSNANLHVWVFQPFKVVDSNHHLKMTSLFRDSSFELVVNVIVFWCAITWLSCIQNVGGLKRFGKCSTSSTCFQNGFCFGLHHKLTYNVTKFQQNPCENHEIICSCKIYGFQVHEIYIYNFYVNDVSFLFVMF